MTRAWVHLWAVAAGYFWLPCPRCGRMFGGQEVTPLCDAVKIGGGWKVCCPVCSEERRKNEEA